MSDEQKPLTDDEFTVPKLPFRKPVIDLNEKIEKSHDESKSSIEQLSYHEKKNLPNPLTRLNPMNNIFYIEIIKNGTVLGREYLNKNQILLGRATDCDLVFEHCSISRYHAMLLWKENALNMEDHMGFFYLKDLDSSHGTFLNKIQVESNKFLKLEPNKSFIKLGASSRLLLFSRITTDDEANEDQIESQQSVKKEKHQFNFNCQELNKEKDSDNYDCMWGMQDLDADNSIYFPQNSGLQIVLGILNENTVIDKTVNDNAYILNPQKVISNWFDYEGYEFEYQISNENNKFKCTITFPIEDQHVPISGEEEIKKKDAINSACLKACRILDKAEILFSWQKREKIEKRKQDNNEDEMLDETGERESKKARLDALKSKKVDNLETLTQRFDELKTEIETSQTDLDQIDKEMILLKSTENKAKTDEELDQYMNMMSSTKYNFNDLKIMKSKAKMKISQLVKEKERIERLIKIAKPNLGTYKIKNANSSSTSSSSKVNELIQKAQAKLNQKKQEELSEQNKAGNKTKIELNIFNNYTGVLNNQKTSLTFNKSTKVTNKLSNFSEDDEQKGPILIDLIDLNDEENDDNKNKEDKISYKASIEELIDLKASEERDKKDNNKLKTTNTDKKQRFINLKRDEIEEQEDESKFVDWLPPEKSNFNNKYGY